MIMIFFYIKIVLHKEVNKIITIFLRSYGKLIRKYGKNHRG